MVFQNLLRPHKGDRKTAMSSAASVCCQEVGLLDVRLSNGDTDLGVVIDSLNSYFCQIGPNHHILTGDVNSDVYKPESKAYTDLHCSYNSQNSIMIPTQICSATQTCIDHLFMNFDNF